MIAVIDDPHPNPHVRLMASPSLENWPHYPHLPLVSQKYHGSLGLPLLGVLVDLWGTWNFPDFQTVVFVIDLYSLSGEPPTLEELAQLPNKCYPGFEEIYADGWVVD